MVLFYFPLYRICIAQDPSSTCNNTPSYTVSHILLDCSLLEMNISLFALKFSNPSHFQRTSFPFLPFPTLSVKPLILVCLMLTLVAYLPTFEVSPLSIALLTTSKTIPNPFDIQPHTVHPLLAWLRSRWLLEGFCD